jgi:hypothetical protein
MLSLIRTASNDEEQGAEMGREDRDWQWRAEPEEHLPPWKRPIVAESEGLSWRGWLASIVCGVSIVMTVVSWFILDAFGDGLFYLVLAVATGWTVLRERNR